MTVVLRWLVLCLELIYAYVTCSISDGFGSHSGSVELKKK
jgi:hypothetical protein